MKRQRRPTPLEAVRPAPADRGAAVPDAPLAARLLRIQRTAGNAAVGRLLQRAENDTVELADRDVAERALALDVLSDFPDLDKVIENWALAKAERFLQSYWSSATRAVFVGNPKIWKRPSKWGEFDMDVPFELVSSDPRQALKQASTTPQRQVKVIARFRRSTQHRSGFWGISERKRDLHVTAQLIDFLDGSPLVGREWKAIIRAEGLKGLEFPPLDDVPEPEPGPVLERDQQRPKPT